MDGIIAVHTGAGNFVDESKYQRVIKEACIKATEILKNGGNAMDACEAAIMALENNGNTNAGFGSNLCWDGTIQCEASIMDGCNLNFGACTNVRTVKNPIQFARRICDLQSKTLPLERIPPMVVAGLGAEKLADELKCDLIDPKNLISPRARFSFNHYKSKISKNLNASDTLGEPTEYKINSEVALDTVGAICIDKFGNSAAGCSSGGILLKIPGRVGQAATYGAGCWASDTPEMCTASCTTGNGEYLMKTLLAREICMDFMVNKCPVRSLNNTFTYKFLHSPFLPDKQELYGGALSFQYDPKSFNGEVLWSHTTTTFCVGYMTTNHKTPKYVCSSLPNYCTPGKSTVVNGRSFSLRE